VARPTDDLGAVVRFYRDGLGLDVLYQFRDHDGFDGVMLGRTGACYHLEFTRKAGHLAGKAPTEDNLLVCRVVVGYYTLFGPAVPTYTATHPMNAELRRQQEFAKPVEVCSDVWAGSGAVLSPGVKIGSKSVIGAGSVVMRDVPEAVYAASNPYRVIRPITE
jgi:hypothetical protein